MPKVCCKSHDKSLKPGWLREDIKAITFYYGQLNFDTSILANLNLLLMMERLHIWTGNAQSVVKATIKSERLGSHVKIQKGYCFYLYG